MKKPPPSIAGQGPNRRTEADKDYRTVAADAVGFAAGAEPPIVT
jgi:hypothetical protein